MRAHTTLRKSVTDCFKRFSVRRFESLESRCYLSIQSASAASHLTLSPEEVIEVGPGVYSFVSGLVPVVGPETLTHNVNAADTTNTDQIRTGGGLGLSLTGAGVTVGVWDGGRIRQTHTEFNNGNRVTVVDNAALSDHSTHVAGTIGARGADANARGMGSGVGIRSRDSTNDAAEMATDAAIVDLSNHSYGHLRGWTQRLTWQIGGQQVVPSTWVSDRFSFPAEDPFFWKIHASAIGSRCRAWRQHTSPARSGSDSV
jgi:hypothetical protein